MIRFLLLVIILLGFLVLSIPVLLVEAILGRINPGLRDRQSLWFVHKVFGLMLKVVGVEVVVKGLENIPKDQAVLYVGNHRSYFDILVGYTTVPTLLGFVAKKEMLRYPLLKNWMRNAHCLFLDRVNMKEGLKTILEGIALVKNGVSVWIFPEGTRNRNDDILDMLPFKEGSLKIAEKSGCPVIPVAQINTADIFEKHIPFMRPAKVIIKFGAPVILKELPPEQKKFAGAYIRRVLIDMIREEQQHGDTGSK